MPLGVGAMDMVVGDLKLYSTYIVVDVALS
jgi:hypothetical protein